MRFSTKILVFGSIFSLISSFFVSRFGIMSELYVVSLFYMMLIAFPSFYTLIRLHALKAICAILSLSFFAIILESVAIATGFPYGYFEYGGGLGPKIFNLAPPAIFLAWVPMLIGAFESIRINSKKINVVLSTAILLIISDMVVDPGAYALKVWIWKDVGGFYGVPWQNFFGWLLSGITGAFIYKKFINYQKVEANSEYLQFSLFFTIVFWSGIALFKGLILPLIIGILVLTTLFKSILKAQTLQ